MRARIYSTKKQNRIIGYHRYHKEREREFNTVDSGGKTLKQNNIQVTRLQK
jgi:hypothetical protein